MSMVILARKYCTKVFDGTHDTPKSAEIGYPLVTSKHIIGRKLALSSAYLISKSDYIAIQKRSAVSQWDILFSMIGSVGEVYLEQKKEIPYAIKNIGVFSCNDEYKAKWLYYYLQSLSAKTHIKRYLNGAVQKFLPLGALRDFPVLEYENSKKAIINILSDLDAKIELNNKINKELEAMAKTLYDYWFVQFDFPTPSPSGRAGVGLPYKSSGGKMVYNEELKREIPVGWEVDELVKNMDVQYGFPYRTKLFNNDKIGKPVIRIRDILESTISLYSTEVADEKYQIRKGALLIGMDGNFHMNFWDKENCFLNQRCVKIEPKNKKSISTFQALFDTQPYIKAREKNVSRTTVGHLSAKDINDLKIIKATESIQLQANETFNGILNKVLSNRTENQQLTALRDWLLPMLMNGQVTI